MSEEEITKKADQAVKALLECHTGVISDEEFEKHRKVPNGDGYSVGYCIALKGAILMYEDMVKLLFQIEEDVHATLVGLGSVYGFEVERVKSPILKENEAILNNLKERLK